MAEKFFFILFYYKCYPTYDVLSFLFDCDRGNACRRQFFLSDILESTLGKKLVLPKRQLKSIEDFFKAFPEAKEVFIDGTERPIQRPKDKVKQKANYSGKKKRHTRKNLIISTRQKRVGFLSKTVEGKQHDFTMLKAQAPPKYIPVKIRQRVDLGFQGYQQQFPNHTVSMPERKPRTRELSPTVKERNKQKSSVRVLVEHALGGVKRLNIVADVFRNKVKGFDDKVMLIACGLWNYHLAMK
ncbi:MAG: transposase [Candidatus Colwellbacteria bacterium]|nr:transposase [Candidatus Colwellbacteria bacterium]